MHLLPEQLPRTHFIGAIPACGRMTTIRWGMNLALQEYPLSMGVNFLIVKRAEAGEARNKMVEKVRDVQAKWIWMLDDDVFPPTYAVQKLMYAMLGKPEVMACAGIVYTKGEVPTPLVFNNEGEGPYLDWKRGKVFEVPGFISTGCMLIRMEAFEKIPYPWFETKHYPNHQTEDVTFCHAIIKAGYKILAHGGVECGHYNPRERKVIYGPKEQELIVA